MLVGLYLVWRDKKRTPVAAKNRRRLGLRILPHRRIRIFRQRGPAGIVLARQRSEKLWNLLRGTSRSFEVGIFDYKYTKGSGKQSRTWKQTVICLQSPALRLPDFMLSPKSFWNMVGAVFGHTDIRIEGRPLFSKIYVLRGSDPDAIGRTFTDATLEFFDRTSRPIEPRRQRPPVAVQRPTSASSPTTFPRLLEDGLNLLSLMQSS